MDKPGRRDYLEGSLFAALLRRARAGVSARWTAGWHRLSSSPAAEKWKEDWRRAPLRLAGILLVSGSLANALTLFLLKQDVGTAGVVLRLLFFLAGLAALRCGGDWESVRKGSVLLRFLFPREPR